LCFLEAIKGVGREGVRGLVGMYEERLCAVRLLDVGFWDAGQKVEDGICIEAEDVADAYGPVRSSALGTRILVKHMRSISAS
jgi:hypothetical protein